MDFFISPKQLQNKLRLVVTMTKAQIKSRYRKTFAGFFWVILNPILTFGVQAVVFKKILNFQLFHYYLFLLSGLIPWIFLTLSMQMSVNSFISNRQTLLAFKVDAWVFILSQIIDNFLNYIITFILLIAIFKWEIILNPMQMSLLLLSSLILSLLVYFLSFLLSILHVFFRDTQFILQFVINLAYFATPIFYPESSINNNFKTLLLSNPLYIAIKPFHLLLWENNYQQYFLASIQQIILMAILGFGSFYIWKVKRNDIFLRI